MNTPCMSMSLTMLDRLFWDSAWLCVCVHASEVRFWTSAGRLPADDYAEIAVVMIFAGKTLFEASAFRGRKTT